jgi:hypothetical protein
MHIPRSFPSTILLFAAAPAVVHASLTLPVTPGFSTSPCARSAAWETFTQAYNAPNFADVPSTTETGASITQLIAGAIITTTGSIYHPFQPTAFRLTDTASADVQEVVLQTSTFGNAPDPATFTLTYVDGLGQDVVLPPTDSQVLVSVPQQNDELYFRWDLAAVPEVVTAYRIEWIALASSCALDAVLLDLLLDCPAGTVFCSGDGSATACPCGNAGASGNGCASSVNANGAHLGTSGLASISQDTLQLSGSGMPESTCLYIQGTSAQAAGQGVVFGDGLRCVSGSVTRLGQAQNSGGSSSYPAGGQQPVSVRGNIGASGTTAYYQAWYRNSAAFCTAGTFNLSNGIQVVWQP